MRNRTVAIAAFVVALAGAIAWLSLSPAQFRAESSSVVLQSPVESPREVLEQPTLAEPERTPIGTTSVAADLVPKPVAPWFKAVGSGSIVGVVRPCTGREPSRFPVGLGITDERGTEHSTEVGEDKTFVFQNLANGRYWLNGGSDRDGWVHTRVKVNGETHVEVQMSCRPEVDIHVVDADGKPISDTVLRAAVTKEKPGEWIDAALHASEPESHLGRFLFDVFERNPNSPFGIGFRSIVLYADPPLWISLLDHELVLATQLVQPGQTSVTFELTANPRNRRSGLKFRVVDDATSAPPPKLRASVEGADGVTVLNVQDGSCEIATLAPGSWILNISAGRLRTHEQTVRVRPGVVEDLGELRLGSGAWISGQLLDGTLPRGGVHLSVEACMEDGTIVRRDSVPSTQTADNGSFRKMGLAKGFYRLRPLRRNQGGPGERNDRSDAWAEQSWIVDLREGPIEGLRLESHRGTPLIFRPSEAFERGLAIFVRNTEGHIVTSRRLVHPIVERILLAPGTYDLEVIAKTGAEPRRARITIGDEPLALELP